MSNEIIKEDQNFVNVGVAITNDSDKDITMLRVDSISKELLVDITTDSSSAQSSSAIAKRDQNHKPVCLAWDETNQQLQEILTDSQGYLLCDVE